MRFVPFPEPFAPRPPCPSPPPLISSFLDVQKRPPPGRGHRRHQPAPRVVRSLFLFGYRPPRPPPLISPFSGVSSC